MCTISFTFTIDRQREQRILHTHMHTHPQPHTHPFTCEGAEGAQLAQVSTACDKAGTISRSPVTFSSLLTPLITDQTEDPHSPGALCPTWGQGMFVPHLDDVIEKQIEDGLLRPELRERVSYVLLRKHRHQTKKPIHRSLVDIGKSVSSTTSESGCRLVGMGRAGASVRPWCPVSPPRWPESLGNLEAFWTSGSWRDSEVLGGPSASFSVRPAGTLATPQCCPPTKAEPFLGRELVLSLGCTLQSLGDLK